jgi:integrase
MRWGYIERNVAALASPPRQKPKEVEALSAGDAQQLMDSTRDDRLGNLFAAALYTGMRQGELLGLRWRMWTSTRARCGSARPSRD